MVVKQSWVLDTKVEDIRDMYFSFEGSMDKNVLGSISLAWKKGLEIWSTTIHYTGDETHTPST
jgi:hypothetical protein